MSQSHTEELENALHFGRCPICDGINCEGYPESCTCCGNCGNLQDGCVCCIYCLDDLQTCTCSNRVVNIWDRSHFCGWCPNDILHQEGEQCPSCCTYCKEFKPNCTCCKKCGTTPCICCVDCGDLRIKCKCWSAKVLSHFMRRAVHYHKMEPQLHVCPCPNTRVLLIVGDD